jgi:hypothetical protein
MYRYNFKTGLQKIRTKMFIAVSSLGLLLGGSAMSLGVFSSAHANAPIWQIQVPATVDFLCGGSHYVHTLLTAVQSQDGSFTGTGAYNPDPSYTWNANGNVTSSTLAFTIVYTGTSAGLVYNLSNGVVADDGSVSGTVDSNCQSFTMPAGSVVKAKTDNHGQYVSSQTDKKAAAKSTVGMPVQSKGHTK